MVFSFYSFKNMDQIIEITKQELMDLITENVKRISLISEENTINREVEVKSEEICNKIEKLKIYKECNLAQETEKYKKYTYSFSDSFCNKNVSWSFTFIDYKNDDDYKTEIENNNQYSEGRSASSGRNGNIWISVNCCNGWINYSELYDTIIHELNHIYKAFSAKKYLGNLSFNSLAQMFYNSTEEYEHKIGCVLYMMMEDEQDCFINGLYAQFTTQLPIYDDDFYRIIENSSFYNIIEGLGDLKKNYNNYITDQNFINAINKCSQIANKYNLKMSLKILRRHIETTTSRIQEKYNNMLNHYFEYLGKRGYKPGIRKSNKLF